MRLVGEIGINHNGSLEKAFELIDACVENQFDVVKFQKRTPEICVPISEWYKSKSSIFGETTYIDYKRKIEFEKEEYDEIDKYCKEKNIDWTASVWDIPSLKFLMNYDVPFIKIPSACLTNSDLITTAIEQGKEIVLSTGMSSEYQIHKAIELFPENYPLTILHCNSSYPCPEVNINLNYMTTLQAIYPQYKVGYSGHEQGFYPTLVAAAMGADMIERHITFDKNAIGSDHSSSLDLEDMRALRKELNRINLIKGFQPLKIVYPEEEKIAKKLRY